jgi:hypothetical protein
VNWAKVSRIDLRHNSYICEAFRRIMVSSAYWMIGNPACWYEGIGS